MFTTRPEILGTFGVAASTHWLASQAAMGVLERGGNAFDAAFAGGMVLQVAEPHLNGPGGDVPIIVHDARTHETRVICGQGPAPAMATIDHYRGLGLDLVPGMGLLAAVVPGAFGGWLMMLRDHGTMGFGELMETALGYAENGVPVCAHMASTIAAVAPWFREHWPDSAAVYLPNGDAPAAGSLLPNKPLARTWRRLIDAADAAGDREAGIEAARRGWYEGFVAAAIDAYARERAMLDLTGAPQRCLVTGADMARWHATAEAPIGYDYGAHTLLKCGPWSQGPVLLQTFALLKGLDLDAMDPTGPDFVHTVVEAFKLAFADRETFYGDPDVVDVPLETLLSDAYNDARRELIGDEASAEWRPGEVPGLAGGVDYAAACARQVGESELVGFGFGEPTVSRPDVPEPQAATGDTCHLDVIDRDGNMVSVTPSGGWLQSSPVIPELGFCLGTRAQMFWLDETIPSGLAPGKRPRTTLTPTLVLHDGEPYMACGTPGGDQQDQWQAIFLARHFHHGMNLQQAIDAPAFHSEHWPSSFHPRQASPAKLVIEGRFGAATIDALAERGHRVAVGDDWSEGRLSAASRNGVLKAAANPRGMQGYAVGR